MPEHYEKREVKLGHNDGERVVVSSGLTEGDKVVVQGVRHVKIAESSAIIPEGHNHNH
jgi:multidrug efflux pump subunit AcrA (membrane-fusion protein)